MNLMVVQIRQGCYLLGKALVHEGVPIGHALADRLLEFRETRTAFTRSHGRTHLPALSAWNHLTNTALIDYEPEVSRIGHITVISASHLTSERISSCLTTPEQA